MVTYKQAQEINNKNFIENNLLIAEELLKDYRKKQKPEQSNQENSWEDNDSQNKNWDTQEDSQQQDEENQQNAWENNQTSPWENWETSEQFNLLSNQVASIINASGFEMPATWAQVLNINDSSARSDSTLQYFSFQLYKPRYIDFNV